MKRSLLSLAAAVIFHGSALADWPMPAHDPQRTSHAPEDTMAPCTEPLWHRKYDSFIPSRAHLITVQGASPAQDALLVTTAAGISCLDPTTGSERWNYPMSMPPGDSPTVVQNVVYVAGTDRIIHAVNLQTGAAIFKTDEAGAPYYVNPLVVNGKIFAGSRDGYFYCFSASDGKLLWYFSVGEPINFSAAYQAYADFPAGIVFFAANDARAYALRADTGQLVWKSPQLPADRFVGFWPVITGERVLLVASTHYPAAEDHSHQRIQQQAMFAGETAAQASVDAQGRLNLQAVTDYFQQYPTRRNTFVLDRQSGQQAEIAPVLWWGNNSGQRYPPAVGSGGVIWENSPWIQSWNDTGRYLGWTPGSSLAKPVPGVTGDLESSDEPEAHSIVGQYLYHNDGGDGQDKGGIFSLSGGSVGFWSGFATFKAVFGSYWGRWAERKYGNNFQDGDAWQGFTGHHGHQNPPVPLRGRVYFHRSNAVIAMEPQ